MFIRFQVLKFSGIDLIIPRSSLSLFTRLLDLVKQDIERCRPVSVEEYFQFLKSGKATKEEDLY